MERVAECLKLLTAQTHWGYHAAGPAASEPTALACLALAAHDKHDVALRQARWLAEIQTRVGSVGVTGEHTTPAWPTSLACLAWLAVGPAAERAEFRQPLRSATAWILAAKGRTAPRNPQIGHDPTILGWSWAEDTHAWMEPTCMALLALTAVGQRNHPRTREGVKMVNDRLLENGGCNFGSTVILGQATLPQVQSTGLAMLALAGERVVDARIEKSLDYLGRELGARTSTASLCYGLLGLAAHRRRPKQAEQLLRAGIERELRKDTSSYKLALLLLASCPDRSWLPQPEMSLAGTTTAGEMRRVLS